MRLWHKDLISVLPRQQLLGQWRECCAIAKNIYTKGSPNHILVNKIMEYHIDNFILYSYKVYSEMFNRNYNVDWKKFKKWVYVPNNKLVYHDSYDLEKIFLDWHNDRYLNQCYYNLQEKYDCGGITEKEWKLIYNKFKEQIYD